MLKESCNQTIELTPHLFSSCRFCQFSEWFIFCLLQMPPTSKQVTSKSLSLSLCRLQYVFLTFSKLQEVFVCVYLYAQTFFRKHYKRTRINPRWKHTNCMNRPGIIRINWIGKHVAFVLFNGSLLQRKWFQCFRWLLFRFPIVISLSHTMYDLKWKHKRFSIFILIIKCARDPEQMHW